MYWRIGKNTATRYSIRSVCADNYFCAEHCLICFNNHAILIWNNILYCYSLSNFYSSNPYFFRQPIVEFITTDDSQRVAIWYADVQSFGAKIKMDILHVHMGHFAYIETKSLKNYLCVKDESARTKFGARVTRFFQ